VCQPAVFGTWLYSYAPFCQEKLVTATLQSSLHRHGTA
jgi:hypothetical protein